MNFIELLIIVVVLIVFGALYYLWYKALTRFK